MQASGIMGGVGNNQFNPQGSYTREQSIVTIMRMENRVIPVSSVTLNQTEATLMAGDTLNLTATFAPENATNKAITWSTSNKSVASVDQNGVVTGQGRGTAVISATAASGASAKCTITGQDENTVEITSDLPVTVDCLAFPRGEVPELSEDFDYRPSDSIVAGTITITDFRVADKFVTYDGVEGTRGVTFTYRLDAKDEQIGDQFYPYLRWQVKDEDGRVVDSGLDRDTCAEYMEPGETDTITISIAGMEAGKRYTVEFVGDTGKELEDVASDEPELRVTGLPITSSLDADDGVTSVTVHSVDMTTEYRPMYNDFRCELTFHCSGVYFYSPRWPRVEWELTDSSGAVVGSGSIYVTSWTLEDDGTFLETETLTLEGGETYTLSFSTTVR